MYANKVEQILKKLYDQYSQVSQKALKKSSSTAASSSSKESFVDEDLDIISDDGDDLRSNWERLVYEEHNSDHNSEVVRYLGEPAEVSKLGTRFDILNWWKTNAAKYPIISQIARHVLAILVSTVASEAAFSTGGRVLDPYRSSLATRTVEALICTQNWLRSAPSLFDLKEIGFMIDVLDDFEGTPGTPPPPVSDTEQASNSTC